MVVGKAILRLLQLPGGFEAADLQTVFKDNGVKAPGQIREFIQLAKLFSSPSNDAVLDSVALKYCGGFVGASLGAVMISHSITGTAPDSLSSAISTIVQAMKGSAAEAAIQWLSENSVDLFGLQIKRYQFTAAEVVREICENRQICNIAAKLDGEWNFWFRKVLLMSAGRVYFPEPMATESLVPIILEEDFEGTKTVAPTAKTLGGPDGKLSDGLLRMTDAIDDLSGREGRFGKQALRRPYLVSSVNYLYDQKYVVLFVLEQIDVALRQNLNSIIYVVGRSRCLRGRTTITRAMEFNWHSSRDPLEPNPLLPRAAAAQTAFIKSCRSSLSWGVVK